MLLLCVFSPQIPSREWVWNVNAIGTSGVWQTELCSICQPDYNWHPFWLLEHYMLLHLVSSLSTNNSTQTRWPLKTLNHKTFKSSYSFLCTFEKVKILQARQWPSYSISEKVTQPDYAHRTHLSHLSIIRTGLMPKSFVQNDNAKMAFGLRMC